MLEDNIISINNFFYGFVQSINYTYDTFGNMSNEYDYFCDSMMLGGNNGFSWASQSTAPSHTMTSQGNNFDYTSTTFSTGFGARYYDSDISVWLSVDPLSDMYPSMSPYMYTAGNPVMLVDLNGDFPIPYTVVMDDGTKIRVTIFTGNGQKFRLKKRGLRAKEISYRNSKRQSLGLLRGNRSREISTNDKDAGDINKMKAKYIGYNITEILVKLAEQHSSISLLVIGNHSVPNTYYPHSMSAIYSARERINGCDGNLYYQGDILFHYGDVTATMENRTSDIDSKWAEDRAKFIVNEYFNGSSSVGAYSRRDVPTNAISGVRLKSWGLDPRGITIGIKFNFNFKRNQKPEKHGTVLYL